MRLDSRETGSALDLAQEAGRPACRRLVLLNVLHTAARLVLSGSLAVLAGRMVAGGTLDGRALTVALAMLPVSAALGYLSERGRARGEADVAGRLREAIEQRLDRMPVARLGQRPAGERILALERHPDHLARLVVSHGAARRMLSVGPLMAAASIVVVSWEAALLLLVATPVMIVFFILAGGMIHARAEEQEQALGRLAAQFADRIRTVPTIVAAGALGREKEKLEQRMRAYSLATMNVLRVAFLNAGIIDFFSSISIAVLAVFLGLGHLGLVELPGFSGLHLWQSLFILMIAPEYFSPFRRFAEQYHAKAEGAAAAVGFDRLFGVEEEAAGGTALADDVRLGVAAALARSLPSRGLVALTGPSGSGKSTCLRALAGLEGGIEGRPPLRDVSWVCGEIFVAPGDLSSAIAWTRPSAGADRIARAAQAAGLLDDPHLPGGLAARVAAGADTLSGGQRMRLAVARALLGEGPILADEPTAKLDPVSAETVRRGLVEASRTRLVIVATHDPLIARQACETIDLSARADASCAA